MSSITDPKPHLSEEKMCNRLGVSARTAQRWRVTGEGPTYIRVGARRVVYSEAAIAAWEAARSFAHRAAESMGMAA